MSKEQEVINNKGALNAEPSKEKRIGCAHYKRRAKFVTPCCNKVYVCRYCHDEHEQHYFNRKSVTELICTECDKRQKVQEVCENCGVRFGKYTCLICNLFDDDDKRQYHCDGCGICRVGGRDRFFHCERCNMCLPVQLQQVGHRCVENVSRSNCPVCLEDIHTSRIPCHIPDCGHLLHRPCFEQLLHSGHYACPTCQTSMIDMTNLWSYLDSEVAATPMPPEYADYKATILCKDCHKLSTVKFHVVGLKCEHCGAYNTCQTNGFHKDSNSTETGDSSSSTSTSRSASGSTVIGSSGTTTARPADEPALNNELPRAHSDMPRTHNDLLRIHNDLPRAHNDLSRAHNDLLRVHNDLPRAHNDLSRAHNDLLRVHNDLPRAHNDLSRAHSDLSRANNDLPQAHNEQPREHPDLPRASPLDEPPQA